jgi:hypothetical protein
MMSRYSLVIFNLVDDILNFEFVIVDSCFTAEQLTTVSYDSSLTAVSFLSQSCERRSRRRDIGAEGDQIEGIDRPVRQTRNREKKPTR